MKQFSLGSMLFYILAIFILAFGIYSIIDAIDLNRMQAVNTEKSLAELSKQISKLTDAVYTIKTNQVQQITTNTTKLSYDFFANDNLRDPDAESGGRIASHTIAFPSNLNSIISSDAITNSFNALCVDTLANRNNLDITKFEPKMAKEWIVSEDGLTYDIKLRDNIYWQAYIDPITQQNVPAKKVTAYDFLFFWNTLQNPKIPADPLRSYYEFMEGIQVVDDFHFKVKWKEPYSLSETFTLGLQPLPEHYYRPDKTWDDEKFAEEFISSARNQWLVGTGPYKLVTWDKTKEVVFAIDENYYGTKPSITNLYYTLIQDPSIAFLEFKRGNLDIYGLQPSQWQEESPPPTFQLVTPDIETAISDSEAWNIKKKKGELPQNYQFEKYQYSSTSWAYIGYNLRRPLFSDAKVRNALTLLVNKERILEEVFLGLGKVISGPFIPQSPYYNHNINPLPFDPELAKKLLAEAGWEDTDNDGILDKDYDNSGIRKPFSFTFIIPSSSVLIRKWAVIIEQDLKKAQIEAKIKPIEWSVYTQMLDEQDFDVCSLLWSGSIEGDPYQLWHSSQADKKGSSNFVGYSSPIADKLIEEGRKTLDKEKRYEIYHKLHEVISQDQPYTFLIAPTATRAQSKIFYNSRVFTGGMDSSLMWIPKELQQSK